MGSCTSLYLITKKTKTMNSISVTIDLNYTFNRWVHYLARNRAQYLINEADERELIEKIHTSLTYDINRYKPYIDRIFFTVDSGASWRKDIEIKEEESFYKSNRSKDYNFDYNKFLGLMAEYCNILRSKNIFVLSRKYAEADDLIHVLTTTLNKTGFSCVVIASDADMKQLINSGENFTYIYDSLYEKRVHYVDGYVGGEEERDIDNTDEYNGIFDDQKLSVTTATREKILNLIYENSKVVDPNLIIFEKMLAGDTSDTIPSVYYKPGKKDPSKVTRFTELRANGIYNKMLGTNFVFSKQYFIDLYHNEEMRRDLASKVLAEVNSTEIAKIGSIADNIKRNIQFVFLHDIVYPEPFKTDVTGYVNEILNDVEKTILHKQTIANGFNHSLLLNTRFDVGDDRTRDFDQRRH